MCDRASCLTSSIVVYLRSRSTRARRHSHRSGGMYNQDHYRQHRHLPHDSRCHRGLYACVHDESNHCLTSISLQPCQLLVQTQSVNCELFVAWLHILHTDRFTERADTRRRLLLYHKASHQPCFSGCQRQRCRQGWVPLCVTQAHCCLFLTSHVMHALLLVDRSSSSVNYVRNMYMHGESSPQNVIPTCCMYPCNAMVS